MKWNQHFSLACLTLGAVLLLANCKKDDATIYKYQSDALNLPAQVSNYSKPTLPNHLGNLSSTVQSRVSDHGATLGRVLFYDTKLSLNNKIACASCHHQENGFADPVAFSKGFDGGKTLRNASSIVNLVSQSNFFWDARETDLAQMVLKPIENHIEMGLDNMEALQRKLKEVGYYDELFENAFGDKQITPDRIAAGLSQFLSSMVSGGSKFDQATPGTWGGIDLSTLNQQEARGHDLFFGKATCASCHNPVDNFFGGGQTWADIGLEVNYTDKGLGENLPNSDGFFKIPSLRNATLTAPYMHDGRFATLMDVVNHYSDNIQASGNLDWRLTGGDGLPLKMNLTQAEKEDLIAFVSTLTDPTFVADPKFSNPFK